MRSKTNNTINAEKATNLGHFPLFVSMIHKHFEKERPLLSEGTTVVVEAPIDLLRLSVGDKLVEGVSAIEFTYRRG